MVGLAMLMPPVSMSPWIAPLSWDKPPPDRRGKRAAPDGCPLLASSPLLLADPISSCNRWTADGWCNMQICRSILNRPHCTAILMKSTGCSLQRLQSTKLHDKWLVLTRPSKCSPKRVRLHSRHQVHKSWASDTRATGLGLLKRLIIVITDMLSFTKQSIHSLCLSPGTLDPKIPLTVLIHWCAEMLDRLGRQRLCTPCCLRLIRFYNHQNEGEWGH